MKKRKYLKILTASALAFVMTMSPLTPAIKALAEDQKPVRTEVPEKKAKMVLKGFEEFRDAFINAELGLRYYYKQAYDSMYRGKKAPTEKQYQAMEYQLNKLRVYLNRSAKRYLGNLELASIAMAGMDEEQKSRFARLLGPIFAGKAYAETPTSAIGEVKLGVRRTIAHTDYGWFGNRNYSPTETIAGGTVDVVTTPELEKQVIKDTIRRGMTKEEWRAFIMDSIGTLARLGEVASTVGGALISVGLAGYAICATGGAAVAAVEAGATAAIAGNVSLTLAGTAGLTLTLGENTIRVVKVLRDQDPNAETDVSKANLVVSTLNFVAGVDQPKCWTDVVKTVVDAVSLGKDNIDPSGRIGKASIDFIDYIFDAFYPGTAPIDISGIGNMYSDKGDKRDQIQNFSLKGLDNVLDFSDIFLAMFSFGFSLLKSGAPTWAMVQDAYEDPSSIGGSEKGKDSGGHGGHGG